MKKTLLTISSFAMICALVTFATPTYSKDNMYVDETEYTEEQQNIIENMPKMEQKYLEYGLHAPVVSDFKNLSGRATIGTWSWRDGLICVTTDGFGTDNINTWHAAIVAPQQLYSVVEAPKQGQPVRFREGQWSSTEHTIWQVGVESTTVEEDYNAGYWAGEQIGKPYNTNFWDSKQTDSFYCSQLVWAAYYYTAGIDLNKSDNDLLGKFAIHPGELVDNPNTIIVYRNK